MALRDLVAKDPGWKLLSLAMAAGIWATVRSLSGEATAPSANPLAEWRTRILTNLPVIISATANDVREFKVQPETVTVTVKGPPEIMAALQEKEIEAGVKLTDIEAARGLRMRVVVSVPPGVTFVRVVPADVDVVVPPKKGN